jgi:hypothetical protein
MNKKAILGLALAASLLIGGIAGFFFKKT